MTLKNIIALFLKNTGLKQTVVKNTFWLGFAEIISRLLDFVLIIYIIRFLGVIEFGKFTFALAIVATVLVALDLGLTDITTRELAHSPEVEKDYNAIFSLRVVLSGVALLLIVVTSFLLTADSRLRFIIWTLGLSTAVAELSFFLFCFVRARQRMEFEALGKIVRSLIVAIAVLTVLLKFHSLQYVSYAYFFANTVAFVLLLLFFHSKLYPVKLRFDSTIWKKFLLISWPLGLAVVTGTIIVHFDSILLGYLNKIADNGWYNAAQKITSLLVMAATLVYMSLYPVISKLFKESKEKLQRAWNYYLELMIVMALPVLCGGLFFATRIIAFVFGQSFGPSVLSFQILLFMVMLMFVQYPYGLLLIAASQQKKYFLMYGIACVVNVALDIILIPRYSLYGASVTMVVTYAMLLLLSVEFVRRFTRVAIFNMRLFKATILSLVSSLFMIVSLWWFFVDFNLIFGVVWGIIIYACCMILLYRVCGLLNRDFPNDGGKRINLVK